MIIIGGGFGGLAAARALGKAPVEVFLIDRTNHHLFQPLLYQVAASILGPAQIASPIRALVRAQKNTSVFLAEVRGVDAATRTVTVEHANKSEMRLAYDYLVIATGASHNYFGHEEFAEFAPGLKHLTDATGIRDRILRAFEVAEEVRDPKEHQDLLTFVLVGGGPTGVELAGSIAELRRFTLASEFRRVNPNDARIILIEGSPRILASFHPDLSKAAQERLEWYGVEVHTGQHVTQVDHNGVTFGETRIAARTVIWTAGVKPSPAAKWLGATADKAGRVIVGQDCSVPGLDGVFVVGDTAHFEEKGKQLPGVAQVALQQGRYVGGLIAARVQGWRAPKPFHYFDKGNMAVVGRNFAVLEAGNIRMAGFIAWVVWALIHILFLAAFGNRLAVVTQWIWSYITLQRGARLIMSTGGEHPLVD
ncbi:MAG: NAD(P)/FAD-dependent oxidoreductase [Verrucomicrobiota bacterium]